jgi:hypothetical protein
MQLMNMTCGVEMFHSFGRSWMMDDGQKEPSRVLLSGEAPHAFLFGPEKK